MINTMVDGEDIASERAGARFWLSNRYGFGELCLVSSMPFFLYNLLDVGAAFVTRTGFSKE